jgi:elongator complex protein 3
MREKGTACRCIRCREYGHRLRQGWSVGEPALQRVDYDAAGGHEVFLTYEDEEGTLFGLLRLRLQDKAPFGVGCGKNGKMALVRELHVYGPEVPLKEQRIAAVQHHGLGKALLHKAERVATGEYGAVRMAIISGVGVREYYRGEDYRLEGAYMMKDL